MFLKLLAFFSLSASLLPGATVALVSSLNPATISQAVTLTATVSPSTATGSVTFFDGPVILGRSPVVAGTSVLSSRLPFGQHALTAFYVGDTANAPATSPQLVENVTALAETGFLPVTSVTLVAQPRAVATGDFNGDGKTDFVVSVLPGTLQLFLNNGASAGLPNPRWAPPFRVRPLVTGDFNGDGKTDLAVTLYDVLQRSHLSRATETERFKRL